MIPAAHRTLLEEKAKELDAHSALVIPVERIVVENRTTGYPTAKLSD
jgi:hypothetical protein